MQQVQYGIVQETSLSGGTDSTPLGDKRRILWYRMYVRNADNQTKNVPRAQPSRQTRIGRQAIDNCKPDNQACAWNDTGARSGSKHVDTGCNAHPKYPKLGLNLRDRMVTTVKAGGEMSVDPTIFYK